VAENSNSGPRVMRANFYHGVVSGEQIHAHLIMTTVDAWKSMPESRSPLWQAVTYNNEIVALAIEMTNKSVPAVKPQSPARAYRPSVN
jgi:hypothetical protein